MGHQGFLGDVGPVLGCQVYWGLAWTLGTQATRGVGSIGGS